MGFQLIYLHNHAIFAAKISEKVEDHRLDISDEEALTKFIIDLQPDFVFHLAAQSLVRRSYSIQ